MRRSILEHTFFATSLAFFVATAASAMLPARYAGRVCFWGSALASALGLVAAIGVVGNGSTLSGSLWSPAPYAALRLRLDPLGATFAAVICGVGLAASVFGLGYAHHRRTDNFVYPLFLAAMTLVVAAGNVYTFLVAWEAMALTSFLLVLGEGSSRGQRESALLYLVMTHVATVLVATSFFVIAQSTGSTDFRTMDGRGLSPLLASLAFLAALIGFGTKAGLVPLHVWLPRAHPVAPSHVSALMSAAMVTTGLYGIIRVALVFLGAREAWWGLLLIALGCLSAVAGVLYSLMERDFKRILAYSTVENVGIIAVALGAMLAFSASGEPALASTFLVAALVLVMGHAWFKSLLFLAAGSVQRAIHTLDIDSAGGLAKRMPATGLAVFVGALAMAGLPPLAGFGGEWLLLRGLTGAIGSDAGVSSRLVAVGAIGALALTAGLAVATAVRLYGIAFLGQARNDRAAQAVESPGVMYGVIGLLALGCVVTGVITPLVVGWLNSVTAVVGLSPVGHVDDQHLLVLGSGGSFSPAVIAGALILVAPLPWLLLRVFYGASKRTTAPVWSTGVVFRPSMQYTATSLAKPIRWFFQGLLLPERKVDVVYHGGSPFPRLVRYSGRVPELWEERLYVPGRALAFSLAQRMRLIQSGSVQIYLLYVLVALVALVVVAR